MILLLAPRKTQSSVQMEEAAKTLGWQTIRLDNWRAPQDLDKTKQIVAYGEPLFVAAMADMLGLALLEPPFNWLEQLPEKYTRRKVELMPLSQAKARTEKIFAKPADDKCFPAAVYQSGEEITASLLLPGDIPTLVSEVVEWEYEYRFFILERKIATCSIYLRDGALVAPEATPPVNELNAITTMMQSFLDDHSLSIPPGVVIDAGLIKDRGLAILEANPPFGSGLYQCDAAAALTVVARSLRPRASLTTEEATFIIDRQSMNTG